MPLTKANATVLDIPAIQGEGAGDLAAGNHEHNLIDANTDWYISPTGDDNTGDGSIGTPWATLDKVYAELLNYGIAQDATLTINIVAGSYTSATPISLDHPNGDRINIVGAATSTIGITSLASYTGSAGNWVIVFNLDADLTSLVSVGQFIVIRDLTTSDYPGHLLKGCYEVTGTTVSTITVKSTTDVTTIPGGTYTGNVTIVPSQFEITENVNGFTLSDHTLGLIKDVIIFNSWVGSLDVIAGLQISNNSNITSTGDIASSGFYNGIQLGGSTGYFENITCSGNYNGLRINSNSNYYVSDTITSTSNDNYGFAVTGNSRLSCAIYTTTAGCAGATGVYSSSLSFIRLETGSVSCYNSVGYYSTMNANINADWAVAAYNDSNGFSCNNSSSITVDNAISTFNGASGFYSSFSSTIHALTSQALSNTGNGYSATSTTTMYISNANANGNDKNYYATVGASLYAPGTTSTNWGTASYSPAVNIVGNYNSIIYKP